MSFNTAVPTVAAGASYPAATYNTYLAGGLNGIQAAWTTYVPVLTAVTTNPTLGTGNALTGAYLQIGKTIMGNFDVLVGNPGFVAGSGIYEVTIPVTAPVASGTTGSTCGSGIFFDSSASAFSTFVLRIASTTTVRMIITGGVGISSALPVIPANSDRFQANFTYQAA